MRSLIPPRQHFTTAELLSPAWTLIKGQKRARCDVWSNQFGFELRLRIGDEVMRSQVVCTQEDLIRVQDNWRAELEAMGWRAASASRQARSLR